MYKPLRGRPFKFKTLEELQQIVFEVFVKYKVLTKQGYINLQQPKLLCLALFKILVGYTDDNKYQWQKRQPNLYKFICGAEGILLALLENSIWNSKGFNGSQIWALERMRPQVTQQIQVMLPRDIEVELNDD